MFIKNKYSVLQYNIKLPRELFGALIVTLWPFEKAVDAKRWGKFKPGADVHISCYSPGKTKNPGDFGFNPTPEQG